MSSHPPMAGLWPSPVTPKMLAASLRLSEPAWDSDGNTLAWVEGRSGAGVVVVQPADGEAPRDLTSDISVRAMVGYGGGDFTIADGCVVFVGQADQRLYRQELAGGAARPIIPAFGAAASPAISPDGRWVVYVHSYEGADALAIVDSAGEHWPRRLAHGRDFYMQPAWSPDGTMLAWIEWDHPNMPWDSTVLQLATIDFPEGGLPIANAQRAVAGGAGAAIFQGTFSRDGSALFYVSDESGWGHIYRHSIGDGSVRQLTSGEFEYGAPAWGQGMRKFAELPSGAIAAVRQSRGFHTLVTVTPTGEVQELGHLHPEYANFAALAASPVSGRVAAVASGPKQPPRVVVFDLDAPCATTVRRRSDPETILPGSLSAPEAVIWTSDGGAEVHGLYYPPASASFESVDAPPLVVLVHGGPTGHAAALWSPDAQFFATRGYAVLQPNYRGSTGYGRAYMRALDGNWGLHDVADARSGAEALANRGLADPARTVIMGGSAGGFTVLQSLCEFPGFYRAAVSMFGIADQFALAAETHKFEAHYSDTLLGTLPDAAGVYRQRSPIFHASKIKDPVAVFQGEDDRVVPRGQSDTIVAALRANGIPHEYHLYPGEGHGWRKRETIEHFYGAVEAFLRKHVLFS